MKSLNWPHLMSSTSQRYLVNKSYLEYSSLDTYYPKLYMDSTQAMKYWRGGDSRWGVSIRKARLLSVSLLEQLRDDDYYDQSEDGVAEVIASALEVIELVEEIIICETFDDLIALGERNASVSGHDYDMYDSTYIDLNPEIGRFRWEANYSSDETYAYHADMRDLSIMPLSDEQFSVVVE